MLRHTTTALLTAALAALGQCGSTVFESLPTNHPPGWTRLGNAPASQHLKLRIALQQPNEALFERALYEVSDPAHARYGQHLSREALASLLAPRAESTAAVLGWLRGAGIPPGQVEADGEWVNLAVTVRQAAGLLQADFGVWAHDGTGVKRVRALRYSVPDEVTPHIRMVAPVVRFGQVRPAGSQVFEVVEPLVQPHAKVAAAIPPQELDAKACNSSITPECLRALYKVGSYQAEASKDSLFGVCGYLEEWAKYDQLELFSDTYAPYAADTNFTAVGVNGGVNEQGSLEQDDVEANLDIQYAVAMSYNTPVTYYSTAGRGPLVPDLDQPDPNEVSNEPYLEFFSYLLKLPDNKLPQTLTTSYGEDEQSVPRPYAEKVCQMIGQLGARGVSVLFSSGDTGVGSACQTNDGKNTTRFLPIFPAACPYVTSVGGTRYVEPEQAASFSSGGFSDIWPRPSYQDAAVSNYLRDHLQGRWKGLYNPEGRGFPDVAAQGVAYHVFSRDRDILVSGTSASAPMFAALVSLLNNARLAEGRPPLGFLNPWLYSEEVSRKGALTDIVHGGSTGCTGTDMYSGLPTPYVPHASWNATPGWDPVTGLGTPVFDKLLELTGGKLLHIGVGLGVGINIGVTVGEDADRD
ncbi:peptidase S8/S53 domain-containing protein [Chaetomium fimeti]|uniref:tripeptidyl-peptidase II n=1 Tax=Chaetomium fimeti TaxID=1854472 RepID=A0AAE0LTX9_9PEZI|nr:peptidase S8/S53 domain-containing protein [Chaetomium fimeti]